MKTKKELKEDRINFVAVYILAWLFIILAIFSSYQSNKIKDLKHELSSFNEIGGGNLDEVNKIKSILSNRLSKSEQIICPTSNVEYIEFIPPNKITVQCNVTTGVSIILF